MRILVAFSILFLFTISCSTNTEPDKPKYTWEIIELENEGTIYSFFGTLNDYVLIGTNGSILKSNDYGESWKQVYSVSSNVNQFIQKADTLFALTGYDDYYSLDNGENWQKSSSIKTYERSKKVTTSSGFIYKLEPQYEGELAQPSLVLESKNGENWEEIFPYNHFIYSIYIDNKDRLYLGINGWEWDPENSWFDANSGNKAIIYHTKP